MAQTNIIELNGKRYDAKTGDLLGSAHPSTARSSAGRRTHQGRALDGFIRPNTQKAQTQIAQAHVNKSLPKPLPKVAAKKVSTTRGNVTAKPLAAHQPQKSKILMRHAVHKPEFKLKTAIKTQAPAEVMAKPVGTIVPKASAYQLNPQRLGRAKAVPRSAHIQRFAANRTSSKQQVAAPIAINRRPATTTAQRASVPKPEHKDIFEAAIAHATSHTEPHVKVPMKRQHKWLKFGGGLFALLLVAGSVFWVNRTNVELYVASIHSGFHVTIPGYSPDGYALTGAVAVNGGKVTLSFRSGSSQYTLTQQASSWDSATLQASTVALASSNPHTLQAAGRTVYLYGNGNATWVDGGVWYNLATGNNLSTSEISNLAASV